MKTREAAQAKMRLLIAEDDPATRALLETYVSKWGYSAQSVGDGLAAWEILQSDDPPRLVLLDWMMPGLDGLELCRKVRSLPDGTMFHIILLTARTSHRDLIEGFAAGVDDYIRKDFNHDELRARIQVGARIVQLQTALASKVADLEEALTHIKTLQGILPICMHCHKIRDDREVWQRLEEYITTHTSALLSHCLCPECFQTLYAEYAEAPDQANKEDGIDGKR
ncbi:MAG: response regulator transcription factor [Desulfobacterota bacterium]|nr:response regulator transcription factor [Thermodesulfobacteriota bacterium]